MATTSPTLEDTLLAATGPYVSAAAIGVGALKVIHEALAEGGEIEIEVKARVARKLAGEALANIGRVLAMAGEPAGRG